VNSNLTNKVKEYALNLGASLVGVANIERFEKAPIMMSPKGLMPSAKSVIVCAIHHPDGAMELGGETHPQKFGQYSIQFVMNQKLDFIAMRLARFLTGLGFDAMPIASSNIWRYRKFMDLDANFAPDMSHIYAATCAGLGQLGWNGLTMTPEYGAWNRFVSVITDAPLIATELYDDIKLCDMCGECIRHCPTDAYRKEVNGAKVLEIEDKRYRFANKNLWRCAWGEHFNLDLDLEIPDVVNEEVLYQTLKKHGKRGGEMGCCLKYCLPEHLRADKGNFETSYRRKKHSYADTDLPVNRAMYDNIVSIAARYNADSVLFVDRQTLDETGIDYKKFFPIAEGAVVFSIKARIDKGELPSDKLLVNHGTGENGSISNAYREALNFMAGYAVLDIANYIENAGFESVNDYETPEISRLIELLGVKPDEGGMIKSRIVFTNAKFKKQWFANLQQPVVNQKKTLTENIADFLAAEGSDNFGFVPAQRMEELSEKLKRFKENEKLLLAKDKNFLHIEFDPVIREVYRQIYKPQDYLSGAKSVIVFAHHFPDIVAKMALTPPAYAVGPYVFSTYQTNYDLSCTGLKLCKYLQGLGYNAVMTPDLTGIGGEVHSPRGLLNDAVCNSLEAVEAGIGALVANGVCYTAEHGFNQRFMAVITDAPLDTLAKAKEVSDTVVSACEDCGKCSEACPARALSLENSVKITLGGRTYKWIPTDAARCEWSKRHALCAEDGIKYTGSKTDVQPPDEITAESLDAALRTTDPTLKARPTIAERCIIDCPLIALE
jgi:epoxyqueuosine reductase QueG